MYRWYIIDYGNGLPSSVAVRASVVKTFNCTDNLYHRDANITCMPTPGVFNFDQYYNFEYDPRNCGD